MVKEVERHVTEGKKTFIFSLAEVFGKQVEFLRQVLD